eukprot:15476212-Alexandrium_andersonii.AAC.1
MCPPPPAAVGALTDAHWGGADAVDVAGGREDAAGKDEDLPAPPPAVTGARPGARRREATLHQSPRSWS